MHLFLPCAGGAEEFLAAEAERITGTGVARTRGGVRLEGSWRDALALNLHSRIAQRVLVELSHAPYRHEQDLYDGAAAVAWEAWFTPRQSFKIELTAQHSPLKSLNFAALKIKDAIVDRFRARSGVRPDVQTRWPDVRVHVHLTAEACTLYIDTSGEPLFKRGWREDKGDAPLKETLAAAMIAASGWQPGRPLYDPCCGSGTIAIEAAQIACGIAAGSRRRFGFEKLLPFDPSVWAALQDSARATERPAESPIFGSDVAFRMVDFAARNAERAGVAAAVQLRGGDALQRLPPAAAGVLLLNPPYGERIEAAGVAGRSARRLPPAAGAGRESAQMDAGGDFFERLAAHWKRHYAGWTAWILSPDLKLPGRMRLKETRRVPLYNGPLECRLFRFDMVAGTTKPSTQQAATKQSGSDPN